MGNNEYIKSKPLRLCVNDATDIKAELLKSGYPAENVVTVLDGTQEKLLADLKTFTDRLQGAIGCHVTVFYAGHAVEGAAGENLLMPIDADLSSRARRDKRTFVQYEHTVVVSRDRMMYALPVGVLHSRFSS